MSRDLRGTIERRNGRPVYLRITMPDGKRERIRLPKDCSEARAKESCAHWLEKLKSGKLVQAPEPEPMAPGDTVAGYVDRWMLERERRGRSRIDEDRRMLHARLCGIIGEATKIASVTAEDLRKVVERLDDDVLEERLAWKTAVNYWGLVTKLFGDAAFAKTEALRVRKDNPTKDVRGPDRGVVRASAYLYPTEALRLLSCPDVPVERRQVYALALFSGLRRGELRALRAGDVSLPGGYLVVARSLPTGETEERSTKSKRPRRVPLELALRPLVSALVDGRSSGALVLPQMATLDVARLLRDDLRTAGVLRPELHGGATGDTSLQRPMTFHDLRHTYATWLALRGENALVIQQRLGHSEAKMTARYIEAAEEVGRGDVGQPFAALPESLSSTSIVHTNEETMKNTGENERAREDSNLRPGGDQGTNEGRFGGKGEADAGANPADPGGVDDSRGRLRRAVGVLRIALSDRSRDLAGRLRRLTAAANDVVLAWDRGAA